MTTATASRISPSRTRYIKLGEGGRWEKACVEGRIIRLGFGSAHPERFRLCRDAKWDELSASFIAEGRADGVRLEYRRLGRG